MTGIGRRGRGSFREMVEISGQVDNGDIEDSINFF